MGDGTGVCRSTRQVYDHENETSDMGGCADRGNNGTVEIDGARCGDADTCMLMLSCILIIRDTVLVIAKPARLA